LEYWRYAPDNTSLDLETQKRLLEVCEKDSDELTYFIRYFDKSSYEFYDRLKKIYDRVATVHTAKAEDLSRNLQDWLMKHSRYFRGEFVARVFPAGEQERINDEETEFETLLNLDREAVREHLIDQSRDADEAHRIYALSLLFEYFGANDKDAESWRKMLCDTATNSSRPVDLREKAIFGAMKHKWPGQEEWFVKLFEDRQLLHPNEPAKNNALAKCVAHEPDRLIPLVGGLVKLGNATVRDNAVQCLVQFDNIEKVRPDAIHPLLP